jgi:hypothetical protein
LNKKKRKELESKTPIFSKSAKEKGKGEREKGRGRQNKEKQQPILTSNQLVTDFFLERCYFVGKLRQNYQQLNYVDIHLLHSILAICSLTRPQLGHFFRCMYGVPNGGSRENVVCCVSEK